jgi:DNA-binding transcriptional ArsR family regulator
MMQPKIDIPEEEIHQILSNTRRRKVLRYLSESGGSLSLRDLSQQIAEVESGESPPPSDARKAVYVALHQTHLPALDDKGLVEYDRPSKRVRLLDTGRDIHRYMEVVARYGISRANLYRNAGIVALATVVAALAGVPVVSRVDPILWATLFLALFVLSAVYQAWKHRRVPLQGLLRNPPPLSRLF